MNTIRSNVLRRLEQIEASLLPRKRETLEIVVTDPWGIIDKFQLELLDRQNGRGSRIPRAVVGAGSDRFES